MVTRIYKINQSINSYKETMAKIRKIKNAFYNDLDSLKEQLKKDGENIDYFKGLTDNEFKKVTRRY